MYTRKRSADEMRALLADYDIDFKSMPFFGWFENCSICTNAFLTESAVSRQLQSQLLADAIPAEPLPAGFTSVPSWGVDNPFGHSEAIAGHKDSV